MNKSTSEIWQYTITYNVVRFPSPINDSLAIDVIWLSDKSLIMKYIHFPSVVWQYTVAYKNVMFPRPVNAPFAIDDILFPNSCLNRQQGKSTSMINAACDGMHYMQFVIEYNIVRLPSSLKAPWTIDVIRLLRIYLKRTIQTKSCSGVTGYLNVQSTQTSKSSEYTTCNRRDLVVVQGPQPTNVRTT